MTAMNAGWMKDRNLSRGRPWRSVREGGSLKRALLKVLGCGELSGLDAHR
jgi:hypothetical protein